MLELDTKLVLDETNISSPNLCDKFSEADLSKLGTYVLEGYKRDKLSRQPWGKRIETAMDLAMQVQKAKTFPWPDCSNVAFPLVTIATLQFHSRTYLATISGTDIVKCRAVGVDINKEDQERADRISAHMSYQVLEEDQSWEEQHDRLLIQVPIVGCAFKKSYFSSTEGHNVSETVSAKDLVMDYYSRSVESCMRKTHEVPLYRNEIYERVRSGAFKDVLDSYWFRANAPAPDADSRSDQRTGKIPPQPDDTTPFIGLEQHVNVDLDGDGYAEPYIITVERSSQAILRIVTRFDRMEDIVKNSRGQIVRVYSIEYFTKYGFIPSPDGGVYDVGFGVLLGPLNESTDSVLNQLVDAGTMANTAGGFLGRGAKIRGGVYTFAPLEWKRVDSSSDDLRKSIYPLPVREPSSVLYNLLVLLINYTNRVSGSTDMMVGESPGQNTPAETSRAVVEQGSKIYNVVFKRIWRCMKAEFRKLYILNGIYLPPRQAFGSKGHILREDYLGDPNRIVPVADPNITSDEARVQQAITVKQSAATTPGYDIEQVERNFLRALRVEGADVLYPGPSKVPPSKDTKVQIEEMRLKSKQMELQQEKMMFAAELMEEQRLNNAKIVELQAKALKAVADIEGDERDREINAINTMIGVLKLRDESLKKRVELLLKGLEYDRDNADEGRVGRVAPSASNEGAS